MVRKYYFEDPPSEGDYFKMSYVGGEVKLTPTKRLDSIDIPTLTKREASALRARQREERRLIRNQEKHNANTHTQRSS